MLADAEDLLDDEHRGELVAPGRLGSVSRNLAVGSGDLDFAGKQALCVRGDRLGGYGLNDEVKPRGQERDGFAADKAGLGNRAAGVGLGCGDGKAAAFGRAADSRL